MSNDLVPVDGGAAVALDQGAPITFWNGVSEQKVGVPAPVTANGTERQAIEKLMGDPDSPYWKGEQAAEMQGRYLALLGGDEPASEGEGAVLLHAPPGADPAIVEVAENILVNVPAASRAVFESRFNSLPPAVLAACRAELTAPAPPAKPVGPAGLREFATRPEGAELVREWGREAPVKLARVRGRLVRWFGRVPADQRAAAIDWFDALSPTEASAIYRVVSA